jgi:hypothetical protein
MTRLDGVPRDWLSCDYDGAEIKWMKHMRRVNAFVAKQREGRSDVDSNLVFVRDWCRFLDPWQPGPGDELPPEETPPKPTPDPSAGGELKPAPEEAML